MKKLRFIAVVMLSGLMMACTSSEEPTTDAAATTNMPDIEVVKVNNEGTVADFSIGGMACEMNCVGSIKTTLAEMEGVETIEFPDFSGENETNHGIVKYNPEVVSPEKMVAAIHGLYDGQYNVTHVKVEEGETSDASSSDAGADDGTNTSSSTVETSSSVEMPNLLDLFARLF